MTEPRRPRRGRGPRTPRPDSSEPTADNPYREEGGGGGEPEASAEARETVSESAPPSSSPPPPPEPQTYSTPEPAEGVNGGATQMPQQTGGDQGFNPANGGSGNAGFQRNNFQQQGQRPDRRNGRRHRRGRGRGGRGDQMQGGQGGQGGGGNQQNYNQGGGQQQQYQQQPPQPIVVTSEVRGWFEPSRDGGYVRRAASSYLAEPGDPWVPPHLFRQHGLRRSDLINAGVRTGFHFSYSAGAS